MANPIADIRKRIEGSTQGQVAKQLGVSEGYLSDLLAGNRGIGEKILKALGIRIRYEYIDKAKREAFERTNGRLK